MTEIKPCPKCEAFAKALEFIAGLYTEGDDEDYEAFKYHIALEHAEKILEQENWKTKN